MREGKAIYTNINNFKHPESEKLYCQKIDIGFGQIRQIVSGLQQHVPIE